MIFKLLTTSVFLILTTRVTYCQPYTNLVLEGAGIRGVAYAGAIQYLEESQRIQQIEKVGGTSVGAIAALAISLGYSARDIQTLMYDTKLQKFNDGKFFFIGGLARLNRKYGWYRGKACTRWQEKVIAAKTGNTDITFLELHERGFKDLYVTGTSLNRQRMLVFSRLNYPDMRVKDAVRISMSIPLYFEAIAIDGRGQILPRNHCETDYDLVVDGGLIGNFPITIFDSLTFKGGDTNRAINPYTLGLRIDTPEQIASDSLRQGLAPVPIYRFKNYVAAFYSFVIENLNRPSLTEGDWNRTVSISSGSIGPKIKRLSEAEKNLLIANGYVATRYFFDRRKY